MYTSLSHETVSNLRGQFYSQSMPSEPQIAQVNFASPTAPFQTIRLVQQFLATEQRPVPEQ